MRYNNQRHTHTRYVDCSQRRRPRLRSSRYSILNHHFTRLRPQQPVRLEEAGRSVEAAGPAVVEAAAVSAAVLAAARAGVAGVGAEAEATAADAPCARVVHVTPSPTSGAAVAVAARRRARVRRPSVSSWGSWAAGACDVTLAETSCLAAPVVGPARGAPAAVMMELVGAVTVTVVGLGRR